VRLSCANAGPETFRTTVHRNVLCERDRLAPKARFIRSVEGLSGRHRFAAIYDLWRKNIVPTGDRIFGRMLPLVGIGVNTIGQCRRRICPTRRW
jgi:hypothetical protein